MKAAADPRVTRAVNRAARRELARRFPVGWLSPFVAVWRLLRVTWWVARGASRVASGTVRVSVGLTRRRGAQGM